MFESIIHQFANDTIENHLDVGIIALRAKAGRETDSTSCIAELFPTKFWMPRARPVLSTCGERLFEISRSELIASSIT